MTEADVSIANAIAVYEMDVSGVFSDTDHPRWKIGTFVLREAIMTLAAMSQTIVGETEVEERIWP